MICRLVFNLTCNCFQSKLFVVRTKIRMSDLSRVAWRAAWWGCHSRCGSRKASTNCFQSVDQTLLVQLAERQDARWSSFGHPRQEECLSHTPSTCHTRTTLVFSHSRTLPHDVLHSPSVSSKRSYIRCAQDTEQKHGKHLSLPSLSPFFFFLLFSLFSPFLPSLFSLFPLSLFLPFFYPSIHFPHVFPFLFSHFCTLFVRYFCTLFLHVFPTFSHF